MCYSVNGDIVYINNKNIEIKEYKTFKDKFKGLMFKKNFNYGLKIKCNGIHTFFMKEKIDVILTDKNNKILYIYKNLKPNRIIMPKKNVCFTYELPANTITNLKISDYL